MKLINIKGIYREMGKISLDTTKTIDWKELSDNNPPELPFGSIVELTISFEENDFLSGKNGIVWATYDQRQSEIIQSALLAQHINSEIKWIYPKEKKIFLIKLIDYKDIEEAIDFIYQSSNGLRLKPDWDYSDGENNKSFELWLSGE